jgi:hypothetical protein
MSNFVNARESALDSLINSLPEEERSIIQSADTLYALRAMFGSGWSAATAEIKSGVSKAYDDELDFYVSTYIENAEKAVVSEPTF